MPAVFAVLARRPKMPPMIPTVAQRMSDMLDRRRDEWLRRVHNQKDHRLGYKPEGGAT